MVKTINESYVPLLPFLMSKTKASYLEAVTSLYQSGVLAKDPSLTQLQGECVHFINAKAKTEERLALEAVRFLFTKYQSNTGVPVFNSEKLVGMPTTFKALDRFAHDTNVEVKTSISSLTGALQNDYINLGKAPRYEGEVPKLVENAYGYLKRLVAASNYIQSDTLHEYADSVVTNALRSNNTLQVMRLLIGVLNHHIENLLNPLFQAVKLNLINRAYAQEQGGIQVVG